MLSSTTIQHVSPSRIAKSATSAVSNQNGGNGSPLEKRAYVAEPETKWTLLLQLRPCLRFTGAVWMVQL
jgi:hypothetical protein